MLIFLFFFFFHGFLYDDCMTINKLVSCTEENLAVVQENRQKANFLKQPKNPAMATAFLL